MYFSCLRKWGTVVFRPSLCSYTLFLLILEINARSWLWKHVTPPYCTFRMMKQKQLQRDKVQVAFLQSLRWAKVKWVLNERCTHSSLMNAASLSLRRFTVMSVIFRYASRVFLGKLLLLNQFISMENSRYIFSYCLLRGRSTLIIDWLKEGKFEQMSKKSGSEEFPLWFGGSHVRVSRISHLRCP